MATPILELISDEVVSRLGNITTGNGYEFTAASVSLIDRDENDFQPAPLAIMVDRKDEAENEDLSLPGNPPGIAYDVEFHIHGYSGRLDDSFSTEVTETQMIAAIQKAIGNGDATGWHNFTNRAIDASLTSTTDFEGPGHDGVTVVLRITYRISEIDPFVVR